MYRSASPAARYAVTSSADATWKSAPSVPPNLLLPPIAPSAPISRATPWNGSDVDALSSIRLEPTVSATNSGHSIAVSSLEFGPPPGISEEEMSRIYAEQEYDVTRTALDLPGFEPRHPGPGFLLECAVTRRPDRLSINGARFAVLHLEPRSAHVRQYDAAGAEVELATKSDRIVRTGYLSHKTVPNASSELPLPTLRAALEPLLRPLSLPYLCLLGAEDAMRRHGLAPGVAVRVKTEGDGCFVHSLAVAEGGHLPNLAGGQDAGEGWADRLQRRGAGAGQPPPELEGVDDAEWDDSD